jgi:hypothetical protein
MTIGEDRVRVKFNPSANSLVDQIKQRTAELIDVCARMQDQHDDPEQGRLWSLAMTHYEDAAMWAVKAATTGK